MIIDIIHPTKEYPLFSLSYNTEEELINKLDDHILNFINYLTNHNDLVFDINIRYNGMFVYRLSSKVTKNNIEVCYYSYCQHRYSGYLSDPVLLYNSFKIISESPNLQNLLKDLN